MPNKLDGNGLQLATRDELLAQYIANYQIIYGNDVNLASDSPDGQMMNIHIQEVLDLQDLLMQIYNSFNPDLAYGIVLDQRLAINGIQRSSGTYTITPITMIISKIIPLQGLDTAATEADAYTVSDNAGNKWYLISSVPSASIGTHVYSFRAAMPGAQLTTLNTITTQVTVLLGVDSVNNPTSYISIGTNEESDAVAKIRRAKSVSLSSQGYYSALYGALLNTPGVTSAYIYDNDTDSTDINGIPAHTIWVIVAGSALPGDIAKAIYDKRTAGSGMLGDTSYIITQVDGTPFTIRFDYVILQNAYVTFTVNPVDNVSPVRIDDIRKNLQSFYNPGVYQPLNTTQLGTFVQDVDPNALVSDVMISTGQLQVIGLVSGSVPTSGTVRLSYNGNLSAPINYNDSNAVTTSKVAAMAGVPPGLDVRNFLTSLGQIEVRFPTNLSVDYLFLAKNSTLTAGSGPLQLYTRHVGSNNVYPTSRKYQFYIRPENVIIYDHNSLSLQILPKTTSTSRSSQIKFVAAGGYGAYTYSFSINTSGATIDPVTGLYTAGSSAGGDIIIAVDENGASTQATVSVV